MKGRKGLSGTTSLNESDSEKKKNASQAPAPAFSLSQIKAHLRKGETWHFANRGTLWPWGTASRRAARVVPSSSVSGESGIVRS